MKKLLAILLVVITLFFSACSKERKFGIEQFVDRMNKTYDTDLKTSSFMLSKYDDENFLFSTGESTMMAFSIDSDNNVKGISLLITADEDIESAKQTYCQMCSIFTGKDFDAHMNIFTESEMFKDIKFADGNSFITVSRFKYTIISNTYSITFMCDRV